MSSTKKFIIDRRICVSAAQSEENAHEIIYQFMERELETDGARDIEFQRVHRVGAKMSGRSRPIIARFLRYPDRERVFRKALELKEDIEIKVYADFPKEIQESRKNQWPRLKQAREERKRTYFCKRVPDKLYIRAIYTGGNKTRLI